MNATTNKIYVANECGNDGTCASAGTVTVINGINNTTATVQTGYNTLFVDINSSITRFMPRTIAGRIVSCAAPAQLQ